MSVAEKQDAVSNAHDLEVAEAIILKRRMAEHVCEHAIHLVGLLADEGQFDLVDKVRTTCKLYKCRSEYRNKSPTAPQTQPPGRMLLKRVLSAFSLSQEVLSFFARAFNSSRTKEDDHG